jgi:hypothetical protein
MNAAESIEQYARIVAALEDRFADEAQVLGGFGLTRAKFAKIQQLWSARLTTAGGASELARAFTTAYAAGRRTRTEEAGRTRVLGGDTSCRGDEETVDLLDAAPEEVFPFQAPLPSSQDEAPWR